MKKHYLLFVHEDVEPELLGPYVTAEECNEVARAIHKDEGSDHDY